VILERREARTTAIVDSHGEWLVRNAWGNYVAFIADPLPCGLLATMRSASSSPVSDAT